MKKLLWIFGSIVAVFVMVVIVGPFMFYGSLVPHLSPLIPKPENAPSDADARYNWKGSGLYWVWQRRLPGGCGEWHYAEDRYVALAFSEGSQSCDETSTEFYFHGSGEGQISLAIPARSGAHFCSIHTAGLTAGQTSSLNDLLKQSLDAATSEIEAHTLNSANDFMDAPVPSPGEHPCGARYERAAGDRG